MRGLTIVFLLCGHFLLSQDNISEFVIPDHRATFNEIIVNGNNYLIPYIYFNEGDSSSTNIIVLDGSSKEEVVYDNFIQSSKGFLSKDGKYIMSGRGKNGSDFNIQIIDSIDLRILSSFEYKVDTIPSFHTISEFVNDELFIYNVQGFINQDGRRRWNQVQLCKLDRLGVLQWCRSYDTDSDYAYAWHLKSSSDNHLLISTHKGSFTSVKKIDTEGEVTWDYVGSEEAYDGATKLHIEELSDHSILLIYDVDRFLENANTDYSPRVTLMQWLSPDGELIDEKALNYNIFDIHNYQKIEKTEDGFFALGSLRTSDLMYNGFITKFDHQGDTIWSHRYRHPDFDPTEAEFTIMDIDPIEGEKLLVLGRINVPGVATYPWIFTLNADGCFNSYNCGELLTTSTAEIPTLDHISVYPNPFTDIVAIEINDVSKSIEFVLFDVFNRMIFKRNIDRSLIQVDFGNLEKGVYMYSILSSNGETIQTKMIIKE